MIPGLLGSASGARYPAPPSVSEQISASESASAGSRAAEAQRSSGRGTLARQSRYYEAAIATTAGSARNSYVLHRLVRERLGAERLQVDAVGGEDRAIDALQSTTDWLSCVCDRSSKPRASASCTWRWSTRNVGRFAPVELSDLACINGFGGFARFARRVELR